ncbi:MAG: hypothetical protein CM15mP120_15480 [Pseudomonadota bacterium]|nr:MAG: hypothetical protein CM15mP120_15480 [Pseudomonadota bacterium]
MRLSKFTRWANCPLRESMASPLFESAAIATAIADLVPEQNLGGGQARGRAFYGPMVSFALSEMECWVSSTEITALILCPSRPTRAGLY